MSFYGDKLDIYKNIEFNFIGITCDYRNYNIISMDDIEFKDCKFNIPLYFDKERIIDICEEGIDLNICIHTNYIFICSKKRDIISLFECKYITNKTDIKYIVNIYLDSMEFVSAYKYNQ